MLEVHGLVKHYPAGGDDVIRVLDGITWTVDRGELAVLYGPSGSGKSTLLEIIAAERPPDSGTVLVAGQDVTLLSRREAARYRRDEIGYVAQSLELIPGVDARDNAALKLFGRMSARKARRRVTPLLHRLGLGQRLEHRPDQLSAGERQRVMIALALAADPVLVLADEPTGTLDASRSRDVLTLLADLCAERDVAMLIATHDPEAASFATHAAQELRDGQLAPYDPSVRLPLGDRAGEV